MIDENDNTVSLTGPAPAPELHADEQNKSPETEPAKPVKAASAGKYKPFTW